MRLSEAILLGLPEIRFTNEKWLTQNEDESCEGCLVGAALFAIGDRRALFGVHLKLNDRWPWTAEAGRWQGRECACGGPLYSLCLISSVLTHLADDYETGRLTAAQIADFIRSIEPAEEETPLSSPEVARPETVKA